MIDIVCVYHRDEAFRDWERLSSQIQEFETEVPFTLTGVDNRVNNRGFAASCNTGARIGKAPIIGFLNPDATVTGPFMEKVIDRLAGKTVITGCRFGKPDSELRIWGCVDWVCGAAFFVRRDFWEERGGFDERFVWGWEETDLIRQAQAEGLGVVSIDLPIQHASPDVDVPEDATYKRKWFTEGARRFERKWGNRRVSR